MSLIVCLCCNFLYPSYGDIWKAGTWLSVQCAHNTLFGHWHNRVRAFTREKIARFQTFVLTLFPSSSVVLLNSLIRPPLENCRYRRLITPHRKTTWTWGTGIFFFPLLIFGKSYSRARCWITNALKEFSINGRVARPKRPAHCRNLFACGWLNHASFPGR